ncbi:hypothetical protein PPL_07365 [Heterostelium album PN500]|uniref:PH domain-containing protein n=1 Tax=Heterostelium pallidum (strain ATCC 26659 / Pp 5 / PN500) TaxID=670386 RepID=D3BFR4_HETP5|nr:hypothetical protein PPL_07365 [Heterostelium album PN500]EFA79674.1 hypothetical protein PPL_07365 [Heterostelium album PN500]|eukprot:XP_020431795.1 hypothetical protein PPL_07365 [Heterostelium album PN500]
MIGIEDTQLEMNREPQGQTVPPQQQQSYINNPASRDKLKKRKNVEKDTASSSPLAKLRSATLQRTATSKLQFVVDLGSSLTKSPSKSTTNALSLHSSVASHNGTGALSSPSFLSNSVQSPNKKTKHHNSNQSKNNTLHRKSVRISQQLKLDEVTKIYAPLSGSEYLSSSRECPLSPSILRQQINSNNKDKSENNKENSFYKDKTTTTTTTTSNSNNNLCNITPSTPDHSNSHNNQSTSISPLMSAACISSPKSPINLGDNKENNVNSLNSPPTSPTAAAKQPPIHLNLQSHSIKAKKSQSTSNFNTNQLELELIKKQVIENCEVILCKISEYQRIVLSLPDLFMLSQDILSTEYEYLIKDTNTISKILSPLDSTTGSDTNTEVICSPQLSNRSPHLLSTSQQSMYLNSDNVSDHSSNSNGGLTEMDKIAQSISLIAKKLLAIQIEMKKTNLTEKKACTLSLFVSAVKHYLETGDITDDIPKIPTEVSHSLIQSTELTTKEYSPEESSDYIYKSGPLIKKGSKGPLVIWKEQYFVLSVERLSIYASERKSATLKPKKDILLSNIVSICPVTKYEYKHCFMLKMRNPDSKLVVRAKNDKDAAMWMLAIDGLPRKNFDTNQSCINLYIKETLLESICSNVVNYRRSVAGGVVRSSHGEEWTYRADGTLYNSEHLDANVKAKDLKYIWNGQLLVPAKDTVKNLGSGKWNGVWLAWYYNNMPFLKYMWQHESNEYLNQNPKLSYKWASRGLVSKIGVGEWLIEGNVPETVVMFIQCLRYCRLGKDF